MCGIAGFVTRARGGPDLAETATAMHACMRHRGPDSHGIWTDAEAGIALSHRRLSIIDLSPAGHQPMVSACGRYVIVYNGEVYNHEDLRPSLLARGVVFRGHSDTEVILESVAAVGIEKTVDALNGMFAFAVWDREQRTLTLVRDRLGIKPLYWASFDDLFLFGSELKALRAHPGWTPRIDQRAVASFLRLSYVPSPASIYQGVAKLEPGEMLTLPWQGAPRLTRYWDPREIARAGAANRLDASDGELIDSLDALLRDAVARQMVADVPLGAFLSGGVDSSTVVALMQAAGHGRVRTYTIGFDEPGFDEAPYAAAVARHLGTDHTELTATPRDALDVIPELPAIYDEPFADPSQIPTYLVSKLTRQHVTVALSGDGGDELFAGYTRHRLTAGRWRAIAGLPYALRRPAAAALDALPARLAPGDTATKLAKLAAVLGANNDGDQYRRLVSRADPARLIPGVAELDAAALNPELLGAFADPLDRMLLLDLMTYLHDDVLTKVDRASMRVALEGRVPLLDHRVVEFAWRLPPSTKIRDDVGKWALREVLSRYVPRALIERPKSGFGIPIGAWLKGPLRGWAEDLLAADKLTRAGLDAKAVRALWHDHLAGRASAEYALWNVLMLTAWRDHEGFG